jgi:hypothetical protein
MLTPFATRLPGLISENLTSVRAAGHQETADFQEENDSERTQEDRATGHPKGVDLQG